MIDRFTEHLSGLSGFLPFIGGMVKGQTSRSQAVISRLLEIIILVLGLGLWNYNQLSILRTEIVLMQDTVSGLKENVEELENRIYSLRFKE